MLEFFYQSRFRRRQLRRGWLGEHVDGFADRLHRAGFEYVLRKHATQASGACHELQGKRISPHVLRHTCALNVLQATGDIRKVALWLGHESVQTTEDYLRVDVTERIGVLESVKPPQLRPGRFNPTDRLIASLRGQ